VLGGGRAVEREARLTPHGEHGVMIGCKKLFVAHMSEELEQRIVETADVEKPDGLEVQSTLEPR
jgi:hypothetical protein